MPNSHILQPESIGLTRLAGLVIAITLGSLLLVLAVGLHPVRRPRERAINAGSDVGAGGSYHGAARETSTHANSGVHSLPRGQ